jgi:hypothetical protein
MQQEKRPVAIFAMVAIFPRLEAPGQSRENPVPEICRQLLHHGNWQQFQEEANPRCGDIPQFMNELRGSGGERFRLLMFHFTDLPVWAQQVLQPKAQAVPCRLHPLSQNIHSC